MKRDEHGFPICKKHGHIMEPLFEIGFGSYCPYCVSEFFHEAGVEKLDNDGICNR